jgi:hypothetical protein
LSEPTPYEAITIDNDSRLSMTELTADQAGQAWRFWAAIVVIALALLGGAVAALYDTTPQPVTCVVTTSGQSLCPEPVEA